MAIHLVLDEDRELALAGEQGDADAYEFLRRVFFVSEGDGPRAASEFNAQPFPVRRDTLNLIVRGLSMQECRDLAAGDGAEAVIARARRGMLTLLGVEEDEFLRRARRRLRSEERR